MNKTFLLLTESYPLGANTEESFVLPEIRAALSLGWRVVVIPAVCRGPLAPSFPSGAELCRYVCDSPILRHRALRPLMLPSAMLSYGRYAFSRYALAAVAVTRALRRFMRDYSLSPADTIAEAFWFDFPASALSALGIPYTIRAHGYDLLITRAHALRAATIARSLALGCASHAGARQLADAFPAEAQKITTAYLGTDTDVPLSTSFPADEVSFITIARVEPVKRVHLIIDLLAALALARPGKRVRWTLIGGGSGLPALRQRAAQAMSGLPNLTIDLLGPLAHSEAMRTLDSSSFHFSILLSSSEGLPVSILETMARAIPAIATDVGGVCEALTDDTGILLPADPDPDIFIAGLLPFLDSPVRYRALADAARSAILSRFDANLLRPQFLRLLP